MIYFWTSAVELTKSTQSFDWGPNISDLNVGFIYVYWVEFWSIWGQLDLTKQLTVVFELIWNME